MGIAKVKSVIENSIAYDAYIEPGDVITMIDGKEICDFIDFKYLTSNDYYVVTVEKKDGEVEEIEIYNDDFEPFGVEFENQLIDKPRECRNKCIFCFMDQLPPNMRATMHFKDDDVRLSFLQGNYVTLTNLNDKDIERIVRLKISPINVSVHTTDGELRKKMLNNRFADKILDIMHKFKDGGIRMNEQIVLCKGINDGKYLEKSICDLEKLFPAIMSVSIVPVGVSAYRKGLFPLESFDEKTAGDVIDLVTPYQKRFKKKYGTSLVYLADEFYISAKRELPPYEHYETFPQIENGVGMLRDLEEEFSWAVEDEPERDIKRRVTIPTGEGVYAFMEHVMDFAREKFPGLEINLVPVHNDFFGGTVNVTGLLTGRDLVNRLSRENLGDAILLAPSMLMADEDIFLDDMTVQQLSEKLGVPAYRMHKDAAGELKDILGTAE